MALTCSPPPMDTTPPSVSITYPVDGMTVSGGVTVAVEASDDSGVSKVELYKNGTLLAVDPDAPYEFYWDTTCEQDGAYSLMAKVHDNAGNTGESKTITVKVENNKSEAKSVNITDNDPPNITISNPINNSKVSKWVDIKASVSDNSGISKVEFYIDDKLASTVLPADALSIECTYHWNTRSVKDGWHKITVVAYDTYNNTANISITVNVANKK